MIKSLSILLALICGVCNLNAQNIGINNPDPQAALDINGDLRLRSKTLTLPQGFSHDVDLMTNKSSIYNFDGGALDGAIITGFTGGVDGRIVTIFNNGNSAIQLYNELSGSQADNRILTGTGNAAVIYQNGSVTMRYDGPKMRWTIVSSNYTDGLSAMPPPATAGNYGIVVNPVTGKVWLDRNLGASQVATSSTDLFSFGDLYQWGRNADGHQLRTSGTNSDQVYDYYTNNSLFITYNPNWLITGESFMWSGVGAQNNPCPSGFRIPTAAEWKQERLTWSSDDPNGAFTSVLKLPLAGYRDITGIISEVGFSGRYWSNTNVGDDFYSYSLKFYNIYAEDETNFRVLGMSVRCIQD